MEIQSYKARRETQMLEVLTHLANSHIAANGGVLELLPIDPVRYPAQAAFQVEGKREPPGVVEGIAGLAEAKFPALINILEQQENKTHEIGRVGQLLKGGNNVIVATNHSNLIDIALVQAAVYSMLAKQVEALPEDQKFKFRTGIVISKMLSVMGYKLGNTTTPATDLLKILCDDIFLTFPRTDSMRQSGLSRLLPDEVKSHNKAVRKAIDDRFDEGGMLLAMAPSGTTDKKTAVEGNTYKMGTLNSATAGMMVRPKTYVLPVAVWLKEEVPIIEVCDIPRLIDNEAGSHQMMSKISSTLSEKVEGVDFSYRPSNYAGRVALS